MNQIAETEKKFSIPDITDERLAELAERIKPTFNFGGQMGLGFIQPVDLRKVAYTWSPKPAGRAGGLKPLCDIRTLHGFGYHGFFKPSIAEVIAQIPEEHLDKVVAFEIVESPDTVDDLNEHREALNAGFHVAKTRLYTRK